MRTWQSSSMWPKRFCSQVSNVTTWDHVYLSVFRVNCVWKTNWTAAKRHAKPGSESQIHRIHWSVTLDSKSEGLDKVTRIWILGHGPAEFMLDDKDCDVSRPHQPTCKRSENNKAVVSVSICKRTVRTRSVLDRERGDTFIQIFKPNETNTVSWRRSGPSEVQVSQVLWHNTLANRALSNLIRRFTILPQD